MPSAYIIFIKIEYKTIANENPDLKPTEMMKKLGSVWKTMSDTEKSKYIELAANAPKEDKKEMKEDKKDKKMAKENKKMAKEDKKVAKENKKIKKEIKEQKVKRPLNGYMKFAQEQRKDIMEKQPTLKITEVSKQLGLMWRALDDSQKNNYKNL